MAGPPDTSDDPALAVLTTCQLILVVDATIVNVALPSMQRSLHFSAAGLSWVVNAYTLAFGGLLLLGGRAGDVLGHRRVFVAGIGLFTAASLVGGLATAPWWPTACPRRRTIPPGFDVAGFLTRLGELSGDGELKVIRAISAARTTRSDPVARSLSAAIREHGGDPRPTLKTGTSDMNTVSERWSVPMAAYGPGNGSLDHSDDEHIEIAEFLRGIDVLGSAVDQLPDRLPARG